MDSLLLEINWVATFVGAVVAFLVGWLWYSDKLFALKWREGVGLAAEGTDGMGVAMVAQIVSTLLFAWVIAVAEALGSLQFVILLTLTIGGILKANGLFVKKSFYAISVEVGYVWVMALIMVIAHGLL